MPTTWSIRSSLGASLALKRSGFKNRGHARIEELGRCDLAILDCQNPGSDLTLKIMTKLRHPTAPFRWPRASKTSASPSFSKRLILSGRGANLRARTGSVNGLTAVDVEDMAGDV